MERMPICRICLVENVPMFIVADKNLHELYETLTDIPFVTEDRRPMLVCYFCFAKLKQCCQLQRKCLEAEELFVQMMNEPNTFVNRGQLGFFSGLIKTPVEIISIIDVGQIESIAVKEEIPTVCEKLDDFIVPKEEHQSYDLELEDADICYSDVEDVSAHHYSESDSEDDVPLMDVKIMEVEEEQVVVNKKRRASDTQQDSNLSNNPRAKKYQCNKCTQIFDELSAFKLHVVSSHRLSVSRNLKYMCSECGKRLKNQKKFEQHCLGHGDPDFECNKCHKVFATKFTLRSHRKIHSRQFSCSYCSRTFATVQEFKAHSLKFHSRSKRTKEKQNIVKQEAYERLYTPDSIIAKVISNNIFQTNSQTNTKQRQSNKSCEVCLKKFDRIGDLKRHLIEHMTRSTLAKIPVNKYGVLNIRCEICQEKVFTKIDRYKAHLWEHAKLNIYKCNFCDKSFSDSSNFCKHKKLHGATYFQCDMCQRKFKSKKMLIQHMEYHNKTRPIQCPYCDKVFHFESMLNKHLNCSHTKETRKKCICTFCRQHFSSLKEKWDHEWIVHNVRKTIVDCLVCGSRFRKYSELKRHCAEEHDTSIPPVETWKKSKLKMVDEDQNMTGP